MVDKTGIYVHDKDENLDQFLKACGVNYFVCKMITNTSPKVTVTKPSPTQYKIVMETKIRNKEDLFTLGQVVDVESFTGTEQFIFTEEGDTIVQTPAGDNPGKAKIVREYSEGGLVMIFTHVASGVEGKRIFKRQ